MSGKKDRTRKQPLSCLPDLDAAENRDGEQDIEPKPETVKTKRNNLKNGKENAKKRVQPSPKIKLQDNTENDSDSDFDELLAAFKKSSVKVRQSATKRSAVSPRNTDSIQNDEEHHSLKKLKSSSGYLVENKDRDAGKSKLSSRKRLYHDDSEDVQEELSTPAKRSKRESSIKLRSTEKKGSARKKLQEKCIEKTPVKNISKLDNAPSEKLINTESAEKTNTLFDEGYTRRRISRRNSELTSLKEKWEITPNKESSALGTDTLRIRISAIKVNEEQFPGHCTPPKREYFITPSKRTTPIGRGIKCATPKTPLDDARSFLHVSAVPESLPCREQEYQNIYNFVESKVTDGVGGCMYISGVPGTGKTATVTQVIRKLKKASESGDLPPFSYIEINGMKLADPRQAYVLLYQQIFGKKDRISSDLAQKKLDSYFNKSDKKKVTTVLLVDELDLMCNRKQDVVYNLLDWPSKPYSRLVVLTIANTMDMPERKLKGRVNSRLGLTRLTFLPYTHKQLEEIVLARLQGTDAFVVDAVRLATRKVAAVSGDARRALDICRRAAELPTDNQPVKITHIEQAIKEMTNSNIVRLIRSCSELEKLFLKAVSEVCIRTGLEEVDLLQVFEHLLTLCVLAGLARPPIPGLLTLCHRLKCFRLLFTNNHKGGLLQRITLNLTQDDLHYALKTET